MPYVLTTSSTLQCTHQAPVVLKSNQTKLTAGGSPVLGPLDLIGSAINNCPNKGPGLVPCTLVTSIIAGQATALGVNQQPILLDTAKGLTNSVPPGTWSVTSAGQTVLKAK